MLDFIYFCFNIVSPHGVLGCYQKRFSFSLLRLSFLNHVWIFLWDFTCFSLEMAIQLFSFPFLFSGHFCSVDACVVCIVFGHWNLFFFFYVIESIFNTGKSSSSLFWTHIVCLHCCLLLVVSVADLWIGWIPIVWAVPDDFDTSIWEWVKDSK